MDTNFPTEPLTKNLPDGYISKFTLGSGPVTFAVKDTIDIKGMKTCAGSIALVDNAPAKEHAWIIEQLLNSGYTLKGKTTLHELAFGVTGINHWSGTPVNPLYPDIIPGGSSSGSATVVASKLTDFSIGTDTGGSVRMPAACCGIIGLKPGFSSISRQGVMPATSSLDCIGFFSRDLSVLKTVLESLAFPAEANDVEPAPVWLPGLALPEMDKLIEDFLHHRDWHFESGILAGLTEAHNAGLTIISHENWQSFGALCQSGVLSADTKTRIQSGEKVTALQLADAEKVRTIFTGEVDQLLCKHRFILLPTLPDLPPTLSESQDPITVVPLTRLLRPFNLSGHPAITLPVGEINNRPVSLQIIAEKGNEIGLINFATRVLTQE
ncbi:amidase family protein [Tatumella sp. UBA2305]|uniref:amidase family protein n=1 Tax=Tatumella sp. UBA2305 TaxID=1947647 RepID=UPI0025CFC4C5|nr:amidase family protein [Tatumella sp. UBA2305]